MNTRYLLLCLLWFVCLGCILKIVFYPGSLDWPLYIVASSGFLALTFVGLYFRTK